MKPCQVSRLCFVFEYAISHRRFPWPLVAFRLRRLRRNSNGRHGIGGLDAARRGRRRGRAQRANAVGVHATPDVGVPHGAGLQWPRVRCCRWHRHAQRVLCLCILVIESWPETFNLAAFLSGHLRQKRVVLKSQKHVADSKNTDEQRLFQKDALTTAFGCALWSPSTTLLAARHHV